MRYILVLMIFMACGKRSAEPVPAPVALLKEPQKIPFSIRKGKEYFDKKQMEISLHLSSTQNIEIKWKYSEAGLNVARYGDKISVFMGVLSPKATPKKAIYLYQNTETMGLLEQSYWEETTFIPLSKLYELKQGRQSPPLCMELKSEKGRTICAVELLPQLDMPLLYKSKLSLKNIALSEEGCLQIGDEEFLLNKKRTYPDLMFTLSTDNNVLYESQPIKNTCKIEKEISFDVYYYKSDKNINLRIFDKDYGFNPSDEIAVWELPLSDLSGNSYRDIGAKPSRFFDVKTNPIRSCQIKGQYFGAVNAAAN